MKVLVHNYYIRMLTLGISLIFSQQLYAQELASTHLISKNSDPSQTTKKSEQLIELLNQLEDKFDITFDYDLNMLEGKKVNPLNLKDSREDVEQILKKILEPHKLKYEKLYDESYLILEEKNHPKLKKRASKSLTGKLTLPVQPQSSRHQIKKVDIVRLWEKNVSGKVTDGTDNTALPGVNVLVKGTTVGTITDVDGNYSLQVPSDNSILVFSSIGYESTEVTVGNQTTINIAMTPDISELEEVVVVGFGERKKKDLTGSIATVGSEEIEKIQTASPQFALQGNTAGVRVVNASGDPNEAPQIFVRGIGTWNGDAQPLYVIDGQIIEPPRDGNEDVISGFGLTTPPNLFNLINPNDIESISVLKDASAAAIYGSRGANGVILITTKKGKLGAPTVELNARRGIQNIPTYDMLNTQQFVDISQEMYANNLNPDITIENQLYGRNEPSDATRLVAFSPQFDPESPYYISDRTTYDWQDELVRNNAINQAYDVKVSGATEAIDYYVSAGFFNQEGMLLGNELTRYTGAVNLNANITDWLKIGVNYKYTHQESLLNDKGELLDYADVAPWQPLRDPNNPYGYAEVLMPYAFGDAWTQAKIYGQGSNPNYLALGDLDFGSFTIDRQLGQFYTELSPIQGLTLRASLNLDYSKQDRYGLDTWSRTNIFKPTGLDPATEAPNAPNSLGGIEHRINNTFNFQSDFTATYARNFAAKHNITLTAAVQDQRHKREFINLSGDNLQNIIDDEPKLNGYSNDLANNSSIYGWNRRFWFGLVGRVNYDYDSKYYLDASFRRDASNGFDDDYRWGNFYSVSGAWRITSESFMEGITFLNDLKFRGGWGEAGNDQAAVGQYAFLSGTSGVSSYRWGSGNGNPFGNFVPGTLVADFPNPSLTWEVVTTTYVGFDALMFNSKLNLTVEWYNRITDGILQQVNLPYSVGTLPPLFNIGQLENRGVDLQLGYNNQLGAFSYGISGNISFLENEVTNLYQDQPLSTDFGRVEEGRSIGHLWGYKVGGTFQSQAEIDAYFEGLEDQTIANEDFVAPGDLYFQNVGGNPTEEEPFYSTTPDNLINSFDQTEIGNTIPGYTYGINLNAGWKGLDISMNFYGEGDVDRYNSVRNTFESMSGAGSNFFASTLNRWTPQNTNTDLPRAVVGDPARNNRYSTRWVESAAFFRLNTWQLGYSLPSSVLEALNNTVRSLRVYVGGQNNIYAFRWSGIDPVNDEFPLPRSFTAGLNIRF
ncbi:SusC/RagA family TonB-linked outer membrane protein [Catalinimonas niigatensis]|uniref:SusC/RagA family TonB-linked outer membrane protein n=1 Tax=Catalinimonas niigatensis TaxID=1397264 RepID=UPI0026653968|nr:TonB-dependent receptor [Catalinimonas niigatensis]WPP50074.1 TonB-dependent receptor [Catalinimonas niigatensis]